MTRAAALVLSLVLGCTPRPRHSAPTEDLTAPGADDPRVVEIDLSSGAPETLRGGLFPLPAGRSYTGLMRALERATEQETTAGLMLRFGTFDFDLSRAEEVSALIAPFRDEGMPVVCHAHDYGNATAFFAARGCSRIWLSAAGSTETVGIGAQLVYLKGLLDRLEIQADFLAMGKYKSGVEPLTREAPSEAALESLNAVLGSIRASFLDGADQGRPGKNLRHALENGPHSPKEALRAGLADAIGFESEALEEARRLGKTTYSTVEFGSSKRPDDGIDIGALVRLLSAPSGADRPHLAVVPAEGAIGMDAGGPLDSGGISAKSMLRTLRRLSGDPAVKAVVLRIDSPGGSPLASDLIWKELMDLREKKPVVASVGSMAASGGYYIACGAQKILADRTSIVGSIGVFGGKIVIGPALTQVGIRSVTVAASPAPGAAARAAYLSPLTPWDDATRARVRAHMESIYDLFIARVAKARRMDPWAVRELAGGRIYSGAQGKDNGLVDEIGGLSRAIALARRLSGLDEDAPVTVDGPRENLLELLLLGEDAGESDVKSAVARVQAEQSLLGRIPEPLRVFTSSLRPLFEGESVLVALPFAITLR